MRYPNDVPNLLYRHRVGQRIALFIRSQGKELVGQYFGGVK